MATNDTLQPRATAAPFSSSVPIATAGLASAVLVGVLMAVNVRLGIGLLFGVIYLPVVLLSLPIGITLWIPLLFLERVPELSFVPKLVAIAIGLAWLGALPVTLPVVKRIVRRHAGTFACIALFLTWVSLSLVWAEDAGAAANDFYWWFEAGAIFLVIGTTLTSRRSAVLLCSAYVIGAALSVLVGLAPGIAATSDTVGTGEASRFAGAWGDPNFLAAGLVPAIVLALGLLGQVRGRWRPALGLAIGVLVVGLAASGSRGGFVAAAVALLASLFLMRGRRIQVLGLTAVTLLASGAWLASTSPSTWQHVRSFDSGTGRVDLWNIAWRIGENHPVGGVGDANFRQAARPYVQQPIQLENPVLIVSTPLFAHNAYLQQLAETGFVGLGLLLGVFAGALRASWLAVRKLSRRADARLLGLARTVLVAQVSALTASFFISNGYDGRLWVLLALGPVVLTIASRSSSREAR